MTTSSFPPNDRSGVTPDPIATTPSSTDGYGDPLFPPPATGTTGAGASGAASTAKDAAGEVAGDASAAAKHVAGTAKEEASGVASEVKSQARELYHQTTSELREQAGTQQHRAAEGLRTVGEQLGSMAEGAESGVAADLVRQASQRVGAAAEWLDERDPGSLLDEVRRYAARRPGAFIAAAAIGGVLVGRLTTSLIANARSDGSESGPGSL